MPPAADEAYGLLGSACIRWAMLLHRRFHSLNAAKIRLILVTITIISLVLYVWSSGLWYMVYYYFPQDSGRLPNRETDETMSCPSLLRAARAILDGKRIDLPFNNKNTLWQFKNRVPMTEVLENINVKLLKLNSSSVKRNENTVSTNTNPSMNAARKVMITFGENCCWYSKRRAVRQARSIGGFEYTKAFSLDDLSPKFRENYASVLSSRRGAGYWIWKPYTLLKVLVENLRENDIVMYQDAGAYFIRSALPLLKLAAASETGVVVFSLNRGMKEGDYTKRDTMVLMDMDISAVHYSTQRLASFVVLRKTCPSIQFAMEWLAYLTDRRIASDDSNELGLPNAQTFKDHRHDQSVLSLLSKKWGLPAYRDPSQYGNPYLGLYYGPYQQLLQHDRNKH